MTKYLLPKFTFVPTIFMKCLKTLSNILLLLNNIVTSFHNQFDLIKQI